MFNRKSVSKVLKPIKRKRLKANIEVVTLVKDEYYHLDDDRE